MSQTSRKKSVKTTKKLKASSFMAMCISCGLFLGFGLGAMLNNVLLVTLIGLLSGAAVGYYIDKKNGIAYTQPKH
jgi:putative flippase GtrA